METAPSWQVIGIDTEAKQIILAGDTATATIQQIREFGWKAMLKIGQQPHFLRVTTGNAEDIEHTELTVFEKDANLIVTRGLKGDAESFPPDSLNDFHQRDGVLIGKPALFYRARTIDDPEEEVVEPHYPH